MSSRSRPVDWQGLGPRRQVSKMEALCTTTFRSTQRLFCSRWLKPICSRYPGKSLQENQHEKRQFSTSVPSNHSFVTQCLHNKSLLRVSGKDTSEFLQGLFTNDMACLHPDKVNCGRTLYTMMLNVQGRVLYDLIMYAVGKPRKGNSSEAKDSVLTELLLECDREVTDELIKTLKRYKIRKKVVMEPVGEEMAVWSVMPSTATSAPPPAVTVTDPANVVTCDPDPRLKALGYRLLLPTGVKGSSVLADTTEADDEDFYRRFRYQHGVAEGCTELPSGGCLPLESNAAFLNGVSFNKGCYVGQELTARTYHTGLTRKRIMPITLNSPINHDPKGKVSIENAAGKKCGTLRGVSGLHGLALLRLPDTVGKGPLSLHAEDGADDPLTTATTHIPDWWPTDTDTILKQVLTDHPEAGKKASSK